jgi:hypothetical protein
MAGPVAPATMKEWLCDGGEIAVLDVREHAQDGEGHLFHATPLPYSRFEPLRQRGQNSTSPAGSAGVRL